MMILLTQGRSPEGSGKSRWWRWLLLLPLLVFLLGLRAFSGGSDKNGKTAGKVNPFSPGRALADDPNCITNSQEGGDCASFTDSAGCHGCGNYSNPNSCNTTSTYS